MILTSVAETKLNRRWMVDGKEGWKDKEICREIREGPFRDY